MEMTADMPSRQYLYQQRKRAEGKCVLCGAAAVNKTHCRKHRMTAAKISQKGYVTGKRRKLLLLTEENL